jgi:hypothetical protein
MSISGIQSSTFNPYQFAANPLQQQLQQLGQALQSGNLSAAQSDFATLQQAFSQPAATSGATSGTTSAATTNPVHQAFNQLASDLQSGNLSAAQKDFSTVQQDLKSPGPPSATHRFPHHHGGGGGDGDTSSQSSLFQGVSQAGSSSPTSNLAGAQQAYAALQQQLQQFALGGGALTPESPISFDA